MCTRAHANPGASRGFTIIELMVAMVVSAIVVLGIFAFSSIQQHTNNLHSRNIRVQQALEGAMWSVAQDVRAAGTGWARLCTEIRIYDPVTDQLINPGGAASPGVATVDDVTDAPYWVLRDGVQAHWNSGGAGEFADGATSSASPVSAADALDVIIAEPSYLGSPGVFTFPDVYDVGESRLTVETGVALDNTVPAHLAEVQQLFPPGTFVLVVGASVGAAFRPEGQSQCALLQITADVEPGLGGPQEWLIPVEGSSTFNQNRAALFNDAAAYVGDDDDFDPANFNVAGASVVPLGRLRWSRYEIDYTVPTIPYLVRYDIIGFQEGVDTGNLGGVAYPHCAIGQCPAPGLHLPGGDSPPAAIAVGPMIEDLQVAVGCDGYTPAGVAAAALDDMPVPDLTYEEVGPAEGPFAGLPNLAVDENAPDTDLRTRDEWHGNAVAEAWSPDCVWYGTAQYAAAEWIAVEGTENPPPAFRMSPQTVRVTLAASSEFDEEAGGLASLDVAAIEDRVPTRSPVGMRTRFTLTEQFSPGNVRWRDPSVE